MTYIERIGSSLSHLSEHHCVDIVVGITSLQPGMQSVMNQLMDPYCTEDPQYMLYRQLLYICMYNGQFGQPQLLFYLHACKFYPCGKIWHHFMYIYSTSHIRSEGYIPDDSMDQVEHWQILHMSSAVPWSSSLQLP